MNYGGGLVAGDHVAIECDVGPGCTVAMTTQVVQHTQRVYLHASPIGC